MWPECTLTVHTQEMRELTKRHQVTFKFLIFCGFVPAFGLATLLSGGAPVSCCGVPSTAFPFLLRVPPPPPSLEACTLPRFRRLGGRSIMSFKGSSSSTALVFLKASWQQGDRQVPSNHKEDEHFHTNKNG